MLSLEVTSLEAIYRILSSSFWSQKRLIELCFKNALVKAINHYTHVTFSGPISQTKLNLKLCSCPYDLYKKMYSAFTFSSVLVSTNSWGKILLFICQLRFFTCCSIFHLFGAGQVPYIGLNKTFLLKRAASCSLKYEWEPLDWTNRGENRSIELRRTA